METRPLPIGVSEFVSLVLADLMSATLPCATLYVQLINGNDT
jgi:hypothetical protein